MKKLILSVVTAFIILTLVPAKASAIISERIKPETTVADSIQVKNLIKRLQEINMMNKSALSRNEKKELRKEVRGIKHSLRHISGGIYISAGAVVLILVLLILLR